MLKGELQGANRETIQGENQEALQSVLSRLLQGALKGPTNRFQLKCFQGHFKEHLTEYFQEHLMEQFKKHIKKHFNKYFTLPTKGLGAADGPSPYHQVPLNQWFTRSALA